MKDFLTLHWKEIIIVIFGIVILSLLMSTTCTRQKLDKAETNLSALTDSIHVYQLKNNELMYEKQGFIAEKAELEQYIGIKEKEAKDIEKQLKSALATIARLESQIRVDTLVLHDSVSISEDTTYIYFDYTDRWMSMDGTTVYKYPFSGTTLNCLVMNVPLKVGTTQDNKWFVTTENPYVKFTAVEGANLEQAKPKRFSLGVQLGVGPAVGVGLSGSSDGVVRAGWFFGASVYLGIGLTYKLLEF